MQWNARVVNRMLLAMIRRRAKPSFLIVQRKVLTAVEVSVTTDRGSRKEKRKVFTRLGMPGIASRLTDHIVRKLAHFCEYMLEGFLLTLCLRVYTRRFVRHISWPILGGLLTALTDETIQMFSDGRSSQITDVWLDFSGVLTGILVGMFCLALCRMCYLLYKHRNED